MISQEINYDLLLAVDEMWVIPCFNLNIINLTGYIQRTWGATGEEPYPGTLHRGNQGRGLYRPLIAFFAQ